jgi:hypothetical protein
LGHALQPNSKLLNIALQKDLAFLDFNFFYFFMQKKNNPRHHAGHVTNLSLCVVINLFFKKKLKAISQILWLVTGLKYCGLEEDLL